MAKKRYRKNPVGGFAKLALLVGAGFVAYKFITRDKAKVDTTKPITGPVSAVPDLKDEYRNTMFWEKDKNGTWKLYNETPGETAKALGPAIIQSNLYKYVK